MINYNQPLPIFRIDLLKDINRDDKNKNKKLMCV